MGRIKRGYVREIPDDELKRDYRLFAPARFSTVANECRAV